MSTQQTNKNYQEVSGYEQTVSYYPNGYIEKVMQHYDDDKKLTRYYLYKNEKLDAILEEEIAGEEKPQYHLEKIEKVKDNFLPLTSKKLGLYNVVSETHKGQMATIKYTYDSENRLTGSRKIYQINENTEIGYVTKVKFNKDYINNTSFKHYQYNRKKKDSIFKAIDKTTYKITAKNNIGVTTYKTTLKDKISYFKTNYTLFDEDELNKGFEYLKLSDLFNFYVDDIIREENISKYVYKVISERVKDTTYQKSLVSENALQDEKWYVKKFYDEYIHQELKNKDLVSFIEATKEALEQSHYFSLDDLDSFRMNAYQTCVANKDYKTAEEFLRPLYDRAKKAYRSNPSEENGQYLGLMAKVCYQQGKNTEGDKILNECNDLKLSMKGLIDGMEDQLKYYRYNYFLAQVYETKNDINNSKKLIEENLAYFNNLEDPYSKETEPFATDYVKNMEMHQRL